jgi:hypothetical protein
MNRDEARDELLRLGVTSERADEFLEVADKHGVASALREQVEVAKGPSGAYAVQTFQIARTTDPS